MELSELKKRLCEIIGSDQNIGERLMQIITSDQKDEVMDKYCDMFDGDLTTDELQKIYQYYYADRKDKKQDYTPKSIATLLAALTETGSKTSYDMCSGSGALTIHKWVSNKNKTFICDELDERVIPFLLFNMAVRNMTGYVINRNVLTLDITCVHKLTSGDKYSDITNVSYVPHFVADEIISNPPYNIKWDPPGPLLADDRFFGKPIPPKSNANYAFVLTALSRLSEKGKCAFILPKSVMTSDNEKDIRRYMIENGLIEKVIQLPDHMFVSTDIPTVVLLFSHGNETVKFYDLRNKCEQGQRDQNGMYGGESHTNRTYHKTFNIIPDEMIKRICGEFTDEKEFCKEITNSRIVENDCSIKVSDYIEFEQRYQYHRPYTDIMDDINRINREKSVVKITINETLAKQMGFDELYSLMENSVKNQEVIAKTFSLLGGTYYPEKRIITLSKNKNELKFENQDKELLSSIMVMFFPMWKQHIYYLNNEQNRLYAELRDAMLPDLMSGNISV